MNLSKEDVLLLIKQYREHRNLWDVKDKWYFNRNKKQEAWKEIGETLGIDIEDGKKKIQSLLGSFRREKSRGRRKMELSKGGKKIWKSDWFAFNSFDFLMDRDIPRKSISLDQINNEINKTSDIDVQSYTCTSYPKNSLEMPKIESIENVKEDTTKTLHKAFELLQQSIERENSTTIFTEYLAQKLEEFEPRTRSILIHKINELIFDAEMNKYSNHFQNTHAT